MAKRIVLRAVDNQFIRQEGDGGELHVPPSNGPDTTEIFTKTAVSGGKVTLEPSNSTSTNRLYISAEGGGGGLLVAKRSVAGDWEKFEVVDRGAGKIALRTFYGQYLCAEAGGGDLLLANRTVAGDWETFEQLDRGNGRIALRCFGGQYVRAEGGGGGRIVVNRDARHVETLAQDDTTYPGRVTYTAANRRFLCAEGGGNGGPVRANRDSSNDDWVQFTLTRNSDETIALQANPNLQWVQAENGGGAGVRAGGAAIGIWEKFVRTPWYDRPRPRKLLVYYGYPSLINGSAGDRSLAGRAFSFYEYVILGRGIEEPNHGDHTATKEIISNIRWNTGTVTKVFGYIAMGPTPFGAGSSRLSLSDIEKHAAWWKDLGVDGIFLDEFGYEYQDGTPTERRARQNGAVDRVHPLELSVIANAWNPDDIWDASGEATTLRSTDFYFSESYLIKSGAYQDATEWHTKAEKLRAYQATHDFRILSVTTTPNAFDQNMFGYALTGAMLYGHEAFGWGEPTFCASGRYANSADFHHRPSTTPGYFTGPITGPTNGGYSRQTDTGAITLTIHT